VKCKCGQHELKKAKGKNRWCTFVQYIAPMAAESHTAEHCVANRRKPVPYGDVAYGQFPTYLEHSRIA
jgi:hypothetical protein